MWIIGFVWCVYNGEWFKRLFESLLLWIVQCYQNGDILLFVWTCHLHYFETWWWKVLCALRKNENLKRMYHFEGRIARSDGYYISRDVSRTAMVNIIEGRVMRRDRCMDRYVPHGSRTERQRVCIIRSDMHRYTWHCIPLHCRYLLLVNLISCFAGLLIAFLRKLWLINIELVIADI